MSETLFRIIFSTLWLIFLANLTWVRYSSRATAVKPPADRPARQEKPWRNIVLAILAPFWFGGTILYALLPGWIRFLSVPLPVWFRLTMAGVAALSIPFTIWGYRTLGKNWVHALEPSKFIEQKGETLVTGGPYRYVRNPIYLGAFTFIIALALESANWLLVVPDVFVVIMVYLQIDGEEKMLLARFGDAYREYMKRTPRLIPAFKR